MSTDEYANPNPRGHVWRRDEYGDCYLEMGDYHGGPRCARCDAMECEHCNPGFLSEDCPEFGTELPGLELVNDTPTMSE